MKLMCMLTIGLLASCGAKMEVRLPQDVNQQREFVMSDWPCVMAVELVQKAEPLYAIALTCQEAYDWRSLEKIGKAVDLTEEEIANFFATNQITILSTLPQIRKGIKEWIRVGGGRYEPKPKFP